MKDQRDLEGLRDIGHSSCYVDSSRTNKIRDSIPRDLAPSSASSRRVPRAPRSSERYLARYRSLTRHTLNQVSPAKLSSFPHIHFLNSAPKALFSSSLTAIQSKFKVLRYSVRSDLSSDSNLCLKRAVSERMNRDRRSGLGVSPSVDHCISKSRVCRGGL